MLGVLDVRSCQSETGGAVEGPGVLTLKRYLELLLEVQPRNTARLSVRICDIDPVYISYMQVLACDSESGRFDSSRRMSILQNRLSLV